MNDLSETINKAADIVHKLTGPVCDDIGAMISDSMKPYRAKNLVNTLRKTERILREAGLPANAVPTRLLFPIVEASSIEDNETLQEMWAGLLATASQETDSVSPSFVETLKQMTPDEVRCIDEIYGNRTDPNNPHLALDIAVYRWTTQRINALAEGTEANCSQSWNWACHLAHPKARVPFMVRICGGFIGRTKRSDATG